MYYKSIFQGRLDYANERAYSQVKALFINRIDNYYHNDAHFKTEDLFDDEMLQVVIPRTVVQLSEKYWKNTVNLFKLCADYAIAGYVGAWMVKDGEIMHYSMVRPTGDKVVVKEYNKAVALIGEKGKEEEAIHRLNIAIAKFDKHSSAYERRGVVNLQLEHYEDARYDFDKSIRLDENNAFAYFGRGNLNVIEGKWEAAAEDFHMAIKKSLALQYIHWRARYKKGIAHIQLKEYDKALFEFKLFTLRKFKEDDKNYNLYNKALLLYAEALLGTRQYDEAIEVLKKINPEVRNLDFDLGEMYFKQGVAKLKAGKKGYKKDWTEAINLGHDLAKKWLQEHS